MEVSRYLDRCANLEKEPVPSFLAALREKQEVAALEGVHDEDTLCIGEALAKSRTITTLDVSNNGLSAAGVRTLIHGLADDSTLRNLSFAGNAMGDEGVQAISERLLEFRDSPVSLLDLR
jgi:hypothetical protein